jgi:outer membrane protein assembly factor BamB
MTLVRGYILGQLSPLALEIGVELNSSPAVANGLLYIGSESSNLYALDAATGAQLWSAATGSGIGSSPAVVNGIVYITSDNYLYAYSLPVEKMPRPPSRPDAATLGSAR